LVVSFFPDLFPSTFPLNIASLYQFPHTMIGSSFNEYFLTLQFELLSIQSVLAFRSTGIPTFMISHFFLRSNVSSFRLSRQLPNW
jgi:hypothetical protein